MSAICSTADDIPMATPEKAPADTSDEILVASPVAETVSDTDDDEDNTATDATSEQGNEVPPRMVRICSHTESENQRYS